MTEHPILFSGEMVRAILDGRKTQTRRVIRPQPGQDNRIPFPGKKCVINICDPRLSDMSPYGKPGDLLILKSSWATEKQYDHLPPSKLPKEARIWTLWQGDKPDWCGRTRRARFVPKSLYNEFPKAMIKGIRVGRVQDISEADAKAEGVLPVNSTPKGGFDSCGGYGLENGSSYVCGFELLWDSINAPRGFGWSENPYVWVIEFERVKS
jgi:hypothetical protein